MKRKRSIKMNFDKKTKSMPTEIMDAYKQWVQEAFKLDKSNYVYIDKGLDINFRNQDDWISPKATKLENKMLEEIGKLELFADDNFDDWLVEYYENEASQQSIEETKEQDYLNSRGC